METLRRDSSLWSHVVDPYKGAYMYCTTAQELPYDIPHKGTYNRT